MKFPIVIIKNNEAPIFFFDMDSFGLVSKNGGPFYKSGMVYDSMGFKFVINGIRSIKKASFLKSLKYFQPMSLVDVQYTFVEQINLVDFKQIVISHIHSFKNYWIKRDLIDSLETSIANKKSHQEVIEFLK